jgi:hypothetical protein
VSEGKIEVTDADYWTTEANITALNHEKCPKIMTFF